eukprot:TRINITY_DN26588_c0_g1_i2.p1 TRINITY_DN26588_c0_g1~~TRINITY_DN26588_c0_g1_i2.p1  ORF type:complete len:835 (+),score=36.39 TRINITY_DN26588_c0_g1_i2:274-2505(+)
MSAVMHDCVAHVMRARRSVGSTRLSFSEFKAFATARRSLGDTLGAGPTSSEKEGERRRRTKPCVPCSTPQSEAQTPAGSVHRAALPCGAPPGDSIAAQWQRLGSAAASMKKIADDLRRLTPSPRDGGVQAKIRRLATMAELDRVLAEIKAAGQCTKDGRQGPRRGRKSARVSRATFDGHPQSLQLQQPMAVRLPPTPRSEEGTACATPRSPSAECPAPAAASGTPTPPPTSPRKPQPCGISPPAAVGARGPRCWPYLWMPRAPPPTQPSTQLAPRQVPISRSAQELDAASYALHGLLLACVRATGADCAALHLISEGSDRQQPPLSPSAALHPAAWVTDPDATTRSSGSAGVADTPPAAGTPRESPCAPCGGGRLSAAVTRTGMAANVSCCDGSTPADGAGDQQAATCVLCLPLPQRRGTLTVQQNGTRQSQSRGPGFKECDEGIVYATAALCAQHIAAFPSCVADGAEAAAAAAVAFSNSLPLKGQLPTAPQLPPRLVLRSVNDVTAWARDAAADRAGQTASSAAVASELIDCDHAMLELRQQGAKAEQHIRGLEQQISELSMRLQDALRGYGELQRSIARKHSEEVLARRYGIETCDVTPPRELPTLPSPQRVAAAAEEHARPPSPPHSAAAHMPAASASPPPAAAMLPAAVPQPPAFAIRERLRRPLHSASDAPRNPRSQKVFLRRAQSARPAFAYSPKAKGGGPQLLDPQPEASWNRRCEVGQGIQQMGSKGRALHPLS